MPMAIWRAFRPYTGRVLEGHCVLVRKVVNRVEPIQPKAEWFRGSAPVVGSPTIMPKRLQQSYWPLAIGRWFHCRLLGQAVTDGYVLVRITLRGLSPSSGAPASTAGLRIASHESTIRPPVRRTTARTL